MIRGRATLVSPRQFVLLPVLLLSLCASPLRTQGPMFIVMMSDYDVQMSRFTLHDMYCLDPVLPETDVECDLRVLAPVDGYFTDTRIREMSVDFEHPSKGTPCRIVWTGNNDVNVTCDQGRDRFSELPAFRSENSTSGSVTVTKLIVSEATCVSNLYMKRYYKFGLNGHPEQRPSVVLRFQQISCRAGAIFGREDAYRTTEAPCRYNQRRRCRPVTDRQVKDQHRVF